MKRHTLKDVFDFVLENKKDKTFIGMSDTQILIALRDGLQAGTLLYSVNDNEEISGMILAEIRPDTGVLFVTENLAMNLRTLKAFATMAKSRRPDLKLEWLKHGIHKRHNTDKIYAKLAI